MTRRPPQELLALTVDPLDDVPVIGLDVDGRVVQWSEAAARVTGHAAAHVLSKHVSELYTEEDVELGRPAMDLQAAAERGYSASDGWRTRADGSRFWARTVLRSRLDDEGRLVGFVKVTCDLTDHDPERGPLVVSDRRLAALLEGAVDGIISADEEGLIILFSRGAERMFGYDRSEVVGQPLALLLPERFRAAHDRHVQGFRRGDSDGAHMARGRVVAARAKDGREFPVEASISRLELEDGAVLSVILRDAGQREAIEGALQEREARSRELADALPIPIAYLDRELRFIFANRAMAAWLGRAPEELQGVRAREALSGVDSLATFEAAIGDLEAVFRGEERRFTTRARRWDGAIRDVEVVLVPVWGDAASVTGCYSVTFDVTDRHADAVSRNQRSAAMRLLEGTADTELTLQSAVLFATTAFADECVAFLGEDAGWVRRVDSDAGPSARLARSELSALTRCVLRDQHYLAYADVESKEEFLLVPIPCVERRSGALRFRWDPPFDVGPRQVEIAEELGERLGGAIDRIELARRSMDAVRGRDWLLQKVTHDLGNPVASVVMGIDRLLRTAPDPDRRAHSRPLLEGIALQANEMRLTIEELFDVSALRTGRRRVHPRATDAIRILNEAVSLVEPIASAHGIEVRVEAAEGLPRVVADASHVRHALSALLGAVIRRSKRGGRAGVSVRTVAGRVVYEVVGPGPDVSGEELTSLLERGLPADSDAAPHDAGAQVSLPLLIASDIVRAHGSTLEISSVDQPGVKSYAFSLTSAS